MDSLGKNAGVGAITVSSYLPDQGIEPMTLTCLALAGRFFTISDTSETPLKGHRKANEAFA